jgi:hypothetical protein
MGVAGMMLAAAALAAPKGLVVSMRDPDRQVNGTPTLTITDMAKRTVQPLLADNGVPPDVASSDGLWSALADGLEGPSYRVELTDEAGGRWTATLTAAESAQPSLSFAPSADGSVRVIDAAPGAQPPGGTQRAASAGPSTRTSTPGSTGSARSSGSTAPDWPLTALWLGGIGLASWAAVRTRGAGRRPAAVEAPVRSLPGRGLVAMSGDAAAWISELARTHRVLLVGTQPVFAVPPGMVFVLAERPDREAVIAAFRALDGLGPPLALVVCHRLSGGADQATALAGVQARLPAGVNTYTFTLDPPEFEVVASGRAVPLTVVDPSAPDSSESPSAAATPPSPGTESAP